MVDAESLFNFQMKMAEMAAELAKVLKESPSEVTSARSQALFKELLTSFQKASAEVIVLICVTAFR